MDAKELSHLTRALRNESWTAEHNPLLDLSHDERVLRLGATPPSGEPTLTDREHQGYEGLKAMKATAAPKIPSSVDWRSYNGHNYVTGVKDQGQCGSCVAFGTTAAIDAAMRIVSNAPIGTVAGLQLHDVSEAQMYYCSNTATDHHTCQSGWWPSNAFAYAHTTGLAPESCFPYTAGNQACHLCPNWAQQLTKVGNVTTLNNIAAQQNWLATRGPLTTCFTVYNDFYAYHSGVYKHVTGGVVGGHCVCVIGYSLALGAWLCKNQWGATFGMGGYFWIGFGQCGIDAQMWGVDTFSQIYKTPPIIHI